MAGEKLLTRHARHLPKLPETIGGRGLFPCCNFCFFFSADEIKFREDLMNIARTTLSSKILVHHRDHFAGLAVDAVLRLKVRFFCGRGQCRRGQVIENNFCVGINEDVIAIFLLQVHMFNNVYVHAHVL